MSKSNFKDAAASLQVGPLHNMMASALSQLNGVLLDAVVNYQREAVEFIGKRMSADLKLQREMLQARELVQLNKLQQEWVSATLADYSAEASKLIEMITRAAKEESQSWAEAQSSLSSALSEQTEAFKPSLAAE